MDLDDLLRLAFVGMHPDRRTKLLASCGSVRGVLRRIENGTIEVPDRARRAARVDAPTRRAELAALGIEIVARGDDAFPQHLAELPDSPDLLFVRGVIATDPGVAVIGSRRATSYGLGLARAYGAALGASGWPVISGLARGIDGAAHQGTVTAAGRGIAILGCGLDVWYPSEHRRLGEDLLGSGGAVVSEYPPGAPPTGWRFPPRNRIISGLAGAVVVVEAAKHGGALITARRALDQGREVLATPGDITRLTSEGCNLLIRDGAIPVFGPDDLIEAITLILGSPPISRAASSSGDDLLDSLGPLGSSIDALAAMLGLGVSEVLARVARLETSGLVIRSNDRVVPRRDAVDGSEALTDMR